MPVTTREDPGALELLNRLRLLYLQARDQRRNYRDQWLRCYRLVNNKLGVPQPNSWQPAPRLSKIYPALSAMVAWMTDNNILIDCTPAADPDSSFYKYFSSVATDLGNVIDSIWQTLNYRRQIKLMLWDASMFGTGILKNVWDNGLSNGYGDAKIVRVDPFTFYPDPDATCISDCDYMIEARRMSLDEIERRWPEAVAAVEASSSNSDIDERPNFTDSGSPQSIKTNPGSLPHGNGVYGGLANPSEAPLEEDVEVFEFWVRENSSYLTEDDPKMAERRVEDRWRVIVIARNVVMMDEYAEDLWSYASHPYEDFRFDDIGEFWGISLVDHLSQPQIYINRLLTALQNNAELTANPVFIEPSNSGISRSTITNRPGTRLTVNGTAANSGLKPDWLQPPAMPNQVLELIQLWAASIEDITGMSAVAKGATPPQQRSAQGTMNTIQDAAFVRIRAAQANLEDTLERCARKIADLIIDNYTDPRFISIVGDGGERSALALRARHFLVPTKEGAAPLQYTLQIQAGSSFPTSRTARIAEADKLYSMQAIDDQALLQAHQWPNIDTLMERKIKKAAAGMQMGPTQRQAAGRKQG